MVELLDISRNNIKKVLVSEATSQNKSAKSASNKHVLLFGGFIKESFLTSGLLYV